MSFYFIPATAAGTDMPDAIKAICATCSVGTLPPPGMGMLDGIPLVPEDGMPGIPEPPEGIPGILVPDDGIPGIPEPPEGIPGILGMPCIRGTFFN